MEIKGQEVKGEVSVMKRCGPVQKNKHGSKLTGQKWKVKELKVGQVKDYDVIMVVVSKVTGRRSVGWKVSEVEGRSGQRPWCHRSWCPTSSVKDAGAKGHYAKNHGVTSQNLEVKGQEVKSEILVMKKRWSFQNNKHSSKLTGQKWKVKELKVGQVKDYDVIMVVVSKVTGRRSVEFKVSVVKNFSGQKLWCNYVRSVKGHGWKVGRVKFQWSQRSVRSKILVS